MSTPSASAPSASAPSERFEVRTTSDSHFAWLRTRLALERTMMAWARTAVSLIGFGFAIVQFMERMNDMPGAVPPKFPGAARLLGLSLIGCGVMALVVSVWDYHWMRGYLRRGSFAAVATLPTERQERSMYAVSGVLLCVGIFVFVAVLMRLV